MKKFLGLMICFGVIVTMSAGLSGCKKDPPAEKTKAQKDAEEAAKLQTETVKAKTDKLDLKAKEKDQKVEFVIEGKAAEELKLTVAGTGVTGDGTIAKDADKGTLKIATDDAKNDVEVTISWEGTKTKAGSTKIKASVK